MSSICAIRSSVCVRPRSNSAVTRRSASLRVMRPRSTASSTASCRRSRVSTTTSRGSRKRASCSRTPARPWRRAARGRAARARAEAVFLRLDWRGGGMVRADPTPSLTGRDQQLEQRLLGVPAVLRLVPDALPVAVEHRLGDLLARVRRQAVQRDRRRRPRGRAARRRAGRGRASARRSAAVAVVAHGDPDVRVDGVGARGRARRRLRREGERRGARALPATRGPRQAARSCPSPI